MICPHCACHIFPNSRSSATLEGKTVCMPCWLRALADECESEWYRPYAGGDKVTEYLRKLRTGPGAA